MVVERPLVGEAELRTTHRLILGRADGLSGEGRKAGAVPVPPESTVPADHHVKLLLVADNLVDLDVEGVPLQDGAASAEYRGIPEVAAEQRIGEQGQQNGSRFAELTRRDDVQLAARREGIANGGVRIGHEARDRIDGSRRHAARRGGVVNLIRIDWPPQGVRPDLASEEAAEVSRAHGRRRDRGKAAESEIPEAVPFVTGEEKRLVFADGSAKCAAEVVFPLIILGRTKSVSNQARRVEHRILVVLEG